MRDLIDLLWASMDNADSRDLDQLTVAEALPGAKVKSRVGVADANALVKARSENPIEQPFGLSLRMPGCGVLG